MLLALRAGIPVLGAAGTGRAADGLFHLLDRDLDKIKESGIHQHYQTILNEGLNLDLIELFHVTQPIYGQMWMEKMGFGVCL